jgi:hypothetical protein
MFLSATSEIQVETSGNDVTYFLSRRPLGKLRWLGLILVGFSVLFVRLPAHGLVESLQRLQQSCQPGFELVFIGGTGFLAVMGCLPAVFGVLMMFGKCRVDWRDERLSVVDYAGLIRWRRRMPAKAIEKFVVGFDIDSDTGKPITGGLMENFRPLKIEFRNAKEQTLIYGYPSDWLEALARDLSLRVGASSIRTPEVEVLDVRKHSSFLSDAEKPEHSNIVIESTSAGFFMEIPPAGLRNGGRGFFVFGIIWCLFMAIISGVMIVAKERTHAVWPYLIIVLFWFIGAAMILGSMNMGRRRAKLRVEKDILIVVETNLFGTKQREWRRNEIAAVRADGSGMVVNDVPIIELQIHPVTGKKIGLFAGRSNDELQWIATELRRELNVPAKQPEPVTTVQ